MLDLENEIKTRYDIDFKGIAHFKDTNIINTSKGRKVLKKSTICPERIHFIHGAKEHLNNNDFKNIDRYLCTKDGDPFFNVDGNNYTISELIEGNECNFDNKNEIINASRLLAAMHKASKGYIAAESFMGREELGKLPIYYLKRLEEIKKLRKAARKGKSKFDYLFLKNVDYFYLMGEETMKAISLLNYDALAVRSREEGIFCHHDFTYRNIINAAQGMAVINFEYCCYEIRIYDLANFIRRKMRKCDWNVNEAEVILDNYNSVFSLENDEFDILKLLLKFPQKFWRVSNKYYNSRRSWSEKSFIDKLQEVIDEAEYHKNFIDKFDLLR